MNRNDVLVAIIIFATVLGLVLLGVSKLITRSVVRAELKSFKESIEICTDVPLE